MTLAVGGENDSRDGVLAEFASPKASCPISESSPRARPSFRSNSGFFAEFSAAGSPYNQSLVFLIGCAGGIRSGETGLVEVVKSMLTTAMLDPNFEEAD